VVRIRAFPYAQKSGSFALALDKKEGRPFTNVDSAPLSAERPRGLIRKKPQSPEASQSGLAEAVRAAHENRVHNIGFEPPLGTGKGFST
jgi:hypothetical protein